MTIGPEPTTQIERRSLRRGTEALHEPGEDRPRVVRPGAGLRVELDGAGALGREVEALDRAVVERDMGCLPGLGRLDGEAVVLARDEHAAAAAVEHRMIRAAMAERELVGAVPGSQREQLVA